MKQQLILTILLITTAATASAGGACDASAYERPETRSVIKLVREASALLEKDKNGAFAEFNRSGSKWYKGDKYLVGFDENMKRTLYPPFKDKVGEETLAITDPAGRPFFKWISEIKDCGWVHHEWATPESSTSVWKSSFFIRLKYTTGKTQIIGSGPYSLKMDKKFVTDTVNAGAKLLEEKGEAALPELKDPKGRYIFRDIYLYVYDEKGINIMHPYLPIEGKNMLTHRDSKGKLDILALRDKAMNSGAGWVEFWWPKPGEKAESRKLGYVKKAVVNGKKYFVGSGYYPN